jgi:protein-disulfide isomerase
MSRSRTVERRKEREQQKKKQQQTTILIVGAVVAVIAIALIFIINQPAEAPIPEGSLTLYEGIPQSKTDEGFPVLGSESAPVSVVEYSSFACSACKSFHDSSIEPLIERVRSGQIRFTYVPMYSTGGIGNGQGAAWAAICAGEQNGFWAYHDALFNWQGLYANTAFSQNRLASGIDNVGLDRGAWNACLQTDLPRRVAEAAENSARLQNIGGTPTILVNGTVVPADLASVLSAIDTALAQSGAPVVPVVEATSEATPDVASEATAEATSESTEAAPAEATPEATP